MVGDIAVVKVEDNFHFEKRVRGCDFIPQKVDFNNKSTDFEKPKTVASIAGWGSTDLFSDGTLIGQPKLFRSAENSPQLLETDVVLISKKNCKKRWDPRYHYIIDEHMLCSKDEADAEAMAIACTDHEVNCKELQYSDDDKSDDGERRMMYNPNSLYVHTAGHKSGRRSKIFSGGFCENDHGGPLIHGQSKTSMVIGIMSACLTKDVDRKCFGPFLYTSVYRYRNLISCAIDKDIGPTCRKLLRSSKTITETFDWSNHVDGLPKSDHPAIHQVRSSLDHFKLMGTSDKKQSIQDPEKKGTPEPALGPDRDPVSPKPVF
ncbi:unnamed protein product [Chrysodeixis includens]|uniref:Peptidase S1 domain-containing protein n=1 Tax=Chrysodeixis includens TaxID=689277 RepID=A0A9P0FWU0_CHRIL|nr:unnamed protein product [Chrysodeixis includens]